MDDDEVNPVIRQALGAADRHVDDAVRRLNKPRKKQPSHEEITDGIVEEASARIEVAADKAMQRVLDRAQKDPTHPEIHVHVAKPDSDPPTSGGAALSAHVAGQRARASGPIAWGLLVVILLLGALWIVRATAPRHGAREVPAAPK